MKYEVKISYYYSGIKKTVSFCKNADNLNELKESFLKHFGNINGAPNKALKEKELVKKLTYEAKSLSELITLINSKTRWDLSMREI